MAKPLDDPSFTWDPNPRSDAWVAPTGGFQKRVNQLSYQLDRGADWLIPPAAQKRHKRKLERYSSDATRRREEARGGEKLMTADEHAAMVATLVKVAVLQGGQYVVRGVRSLSKEKKLIEERAKHWLIKQHHYRGKGKGTVYYAKSREQRLRGLGTDAQGRPPQAPKAKTPAYKTTPEYKRRVLRGQRLQAAGKKRGLSSLWLRPE